MTREELRGALDASMARLAGTVAGLTDQQVGGATLIPPWTRGHVLTHLARATDSLCRLLEGARTGAAIPQYPSMAARAAEIEAGADRPVAALAEDLAGSAERFATALRALPEAAWQARVRMRTGETRTPAGLMETRLRELEIHHADLDAGYTFADIPAGTVRWILDDIVAALARREADAEKGAEMGAGADGDGAGRASAVRIEATDADFARAIGSGDGGEGPVVLGRSADLLAWLTGRSPAGAGLATSGGAGVPSPPYWI
ncbi:maleylpyruvate isomerase family mycothiol-dependent enzyme [Streptomyces endophytica]|uniref:Maleylpyruvate isomerase family mycothiol-dependent enzyme n=1 Tax=Streptomyces endophytica TaxID=2991496 RepID=A0ABY6PCF8_9ACTN|nr:maleylpyruvate isomerase family mycothiol-dependent enzyme [Streptomyces endophytica]UZJ31515.1 maleylpyruvate isomerase family mycothiol-dependent enzyme [Streptomyces endophytica]